MEHIFCLGHVLLSLKIPKFSSQIRKDLKDLIANYNEAWKDLDENDLSDLRKYLSKVGLTYQDKNIQVLDSKKLDSCSMLRRVGFNEKFIC